MEAADSLAPLKEVAIVAADRAAAAMAKLTGQEITGAAPSVRLVALEEVLTEVGDITSVSSVVVVKIQGDVQGLLVFSLNPDDAHLVVKDTIKQLSASAYADQDQIVLCEMVNIIAGAVLNSIAKILDLHLKQSPPASTTDMLGAALDPFLAEFGTRFDKVLIQKEVFVMPARGAGLKFLAIIDPPSTELMLKKVTDKAGEDAANH